MFFKLYNEYERNDLLAFVGSKQNQSGIIWGTTRPDCVILTSGGKHGKNAGYRDLKNNDGTWLYVGQGSVGDQNPNSFANSLLIDKNHSILLFSTREPTSSEIKSRGNRNKQYKFEGLFDVLSWDLVLSQSGDRKDDKLLVFNLIPVDNIFDSFEINTALESRPSGTLSELRNKVLNALPNTSTRLTTTEYRYRSTIIKDYALLRAGDKCELCLRIAPFISMKDNPFLEVHHIFKLADDGPDEPKNVAAICPNCHREAHFGKNHLEIKKKLMSIIKLKEESWPVE